MIETVATAEKLEGSRVRLSVEVPVADLQTEYGRAIQRVSSRVKIPGFLRERRRASWSKMLRVWRRLCRKCLKQWCLGLIHQRLRKLA